MRSLTCGSGRANLQSLKEAEMIYVPREEPGQFALRDRGPLRNTPTVH